MPGETFGSNKPYIYIIEGVLKQNASETTPRAERRDYELKNGTKGTKYEISYKSWTGKIQDLIVKKGKYGEMLEVEFDDAIFTIGTESRYFKDFVQKLASANVNRPITISPYAFESNGKPLKGVTIYQDGEKLKSWYWDDGIGEKGAYCNGFPKPKGDVSKFNEDDWKVYYIGVKKFLIQELDDIKNELAFSDEATQPEPMEDIPTIEETPETPETPEIAEVNDEEVTVGGEKVPF